MELIELEKIKNYSFEADLLKIAQEIDDKVSLRSYNDEQILILVKEISKIDLLSLEYETREEILHLLCDSISYYDIFSRVNWDNIIKMKNGLEDDLKEYIKEFIESE